MNSHGERFLKRWTEELSRTIEVEIESAPFEDSQSAADLLWWKQAVEGDASFAIWIGAEESCWQALGKAAGSAGDPKDAYFELLKQTNGSWTATLTTELRKPLRCGEGTEDDAPQLESLDLIEVGITLGGNKLPALLVGVEERAVTILNAATGTSKLPVPASASPMLDRLMDLQLPITVLLGRAVLPIRDVLKISSGSLIELDRQISDYVEVRVHGTVVARGEIVSVRGNYGVRIREIISRQDRIALQDAA